MATSTLAADLGGVCCIGTFRGVTEGRYPKLRIEFIRRGDDGPVVVQQDLDFRAFHPQLGQTEVGKALEHLVDGDRVVVTLFTKARIFQYRENSLPGAAYPHAKGETGAMVALEATAITVLV